MSGYVVGEGFFAVKSQDVEGQVDAADLEFVAAVVEESGELGEHVQAFLVCDEASGREPFPPVPRGRKLSRNGGNFI